MTLKSTDDQDLCIKVPVLKFPDGGLSACNQNRVVETETTTEDPHWAEFGEFDKFEEDTSANRSEAFADLVSWILPTMDVNIDVLEKWSDEYYPHLICGCIEAMQTACLENNIVELWGDNVRHRTLLHFSLERLIVIFCAGRVQRR